MAGHVARKWLKLKLSTHSSAKVQCTCILLIYNSNYRNTIECLASISLICVVRTHFCRKGTITDVCEQGSAKVL